MRASRFGVCDMCDSFDGARQPEVEATGGDGAANDDTPISEGYLGQVFGVDARREQDAILVGDLSSAATVLDHSITVAEGRNRSSTSWQNKECTIADMIGEHYLEFKRSDDKDSYAITNGPLTGPRRLKDACACQSIISFDDDTGQGIWALAKAVAAEGWLAVLYDTYSHLKKRTKVKEGPFLRWLCKTGRHSGHVANIEAEDKRRWLVEYLIEQKQIKPELLKDARIVGEHIYAHHKKTGAQKWEMELEHAPIPRTRVVLFLKDPHQFPLGETGRR